MEDKTLLKECCINCHCYLSSLENCQGTGNVEEDSCFEYKETLYRLKTKSLEISITPITIVVSGPYGDLPFKLTKEDVWGEYDENYNLIKKGMIVAKYKDICPYFTDVVPYKSVTVVCDKDQEEEVTYWLEYVHGANSISNKKILDNDKIALRSNYKCW